MPSAPSTHLFQLIQSLSKSERRYVKVALQTKDDTLRKTRLLFDVLEQQPVLDEEAVVACEPAIMRQQLSNLKAQLYEKILQALRSYHRHRSPDIRIRECIDQAQLLFDRGLYIHCSKLLKKAKRRAVQNDNLELQLEILKLEKSVLAQGIGGENSDKVNAIIQQVQEVNTKINNINTLSNIRVRLNHWYIKTGFVRKAPYSEEIKQYIQENLPPLEEATLSFREKTNLYDVYVAYYLFIQDFAQTYVYARKWVELFNRHPSFITHQPLVYVRSLHKLMIAQYRLLRFKEFDATARLLQAVYDMPGITLNQNLRAMLFKYTTIHKMNRHFLTGDFTGGVSWVQHIERDLDQFVDTLGKHATIIFYYKIACMYFGAGQHRLATFWSQKIINEQQVDLREDVHCFARILNLISHYELGNTDIIDYYIKSTYRFLLKKDDLGLYQKYILDFLKNLHRETTEVELIDRFEQLWAQMLTLIDRPYERRAFTYFDIISWLESKMRGCSVEAVIQEKVTQRR